MSKECICGAAYDGDCEMEQCPHYGLHTDGAFCDHDFCLVINDTRHCIAASFDLPKKDIPDYLRRRRRRHKTSRNFR